MYHLLALVVAYVNKSGVVASASLVLHITDAKPALLRQKKKQATMCTCPPVQHVTTNPGDLASTGPLFKICINTEKHGDKLSVVPNSASVGVELKHGI